MKFLLGVASGIVAAAATSNELNVKCHALALSGGGDKVAWVAGVVKGLVQRMQGSDDRWGSEDSRWAVVTGMSTGSLLASISAGYGVGDEVRMADAMVDVAKSLTNTPEQSRVFTAWPADVEPSTQMALTNSSVLSETLDDIFDDFTTWKGRMFSFGGTNLATGELKLWDESSFIYWEHYWPAVNKSRWAQNVRAAMSTPGIDEPVQIGDELFASGSIILGTDVFSAIMKCQERGFHDQNIVVDVVTGDSPQLPDWNETRDDHTLPLAHRNQEITAVVQQLQDVYDACDAYPNVTWRYFVQPGSEGLPSSGVDYNATVMAQMVDLGIQAAQTAPEGGQCSFADSSRKSKNMPRGQAESANGAAKCHALAISGGGAKGAYEAGAIKALIDRTAPSERQWQYVSGISAGSILTSASALYDFGDEVAMGEFMVSSINNFTNTNGTVGNVYVDWPTGQQQLTETGFECTAPLFETLKRMLGSQTKGARKFTIGATDDATGKLHLFDETDTLDADGSFNYTKLALIVRASSAIPGVFESVKLDGVVYSDGSTVMGINVFSAINRCMAAGYAESDIVLDVVTANSKRLTNWDAANHTTVGDIQARAQEIQSFTTAMSDILDACRAHPSVDWRYFVQAPTDLPGGATSFNTKALSAMTEIGLSDGANAPIGSQCASAETYRNSRIVEDMRKKAVKQLIV